MKHTLFWKNLVFCTLLFALFLAACGPAPVTPQATPAISQAQPEETQAIPITPPAEPSAVPTEPATQASQSPGVYPPPSTFEAISSPSGYPAPSVSETNPPPPAFPALIWLKQSESAFGDPPQVWALRQGVLVAENAPAPIQLFWDYSPHTGRLAYSPTFWHASQAGSMSVSDLHVFDYHSGQDVEWLSDNVARAQWQPVVTGSDPEWLAIGLFNNETTQFDLALISGPGEPKVIAENIVLKYAWSPDGTHIAFVRPDSRDPNAHGHVVVVPVDGGEELFLGEFLYAQMGGFGDRPLWLADQAIVTARYVEEHSFPLNIYPLDGSGPSQLGGEITHEDQLGVPVNMLWSPQHNQLIVEMEGGQVIRPGVWVYTLSSDLSTIVETYRIPTTENYIAWALGWLEPGETLLVVEESKPLVWSLEDQSFVTNAP